ncbi:MAG TPA: protein translocase subunit SecF [Candidatus Dormibacteraeota bacterium]|jgi:preprotein translocase SecF subunit|nr:protein translocase subunit SecF [Candidatus Dormibacteraeota bacterium]
MFELFKNPNINFIGRRRWAYIISILFILAGVGSMVARGGLRYGIDFSGGTLIQVRFEKPVPVDRIRAALETVHMGESVIQEFGDTREYLLRLPLTDVSSEEVTRRIQEALAKDAALGPPEIRRVEFVGPQVGRDLQIQAIYAALWSTAGILAYVAFRFDLLGGLASVAAIVHDVLICLAALSLTNREMSLPVLAALLTIIGYSVNDTIVAYDRVRENRLKGRRKGETFETQINNAINQTLSRTVLTALTVFFTTAVLYLFGGKVLEDMAFILTIGVVTGTFSTVYIAGSLIVDWTTWRERWLARKKKVVAKA